MAWAAIAFSCYKEWTYIPYTTFEDGAFHFQTNSEHWALMSVK